MVQNTVSKPSAPYNLRKYTNNSSNNPRRSIDYSSTTSYSSSSTSSSPSPSPSLTTPGDKQTSSKSSDAMVKLCFEGPSSGDNDITLVTNETTVIDQSNMVTTRSKVKRLQQTETPNGPIFRSTAGIDVKTTVTRSTATRKTSAIDQLDVDDEDSELVSLVYQSLADSSSTVYRSKRFNVVNHNQISIQSKKQIEAKKKKRTNWPVAVKNSDDYEEDDEGDGQEDEEEIDDNQSRESNPQKVQFKLPVTESAASRNTPPHKRFRKLRLFDTPHTPKTLIKKSHLAESQTDCESGSSKKSEVEKKLTLSSSHDVTPPQHINESNEVIKNFNKTPKSIGVFHSSRKKNHSTITKKHGSSSNFDRDVDMDPCDIYDSDFSHQSYHIQANNKLFAHSANKALNFDDTDTEEHENEKPKSIEPKSKDEVFQFKTCMFKPIEGNPITTSDFHHAHSMRHRINPPNSPFLGCNQVYTSINPFTPTHSQIGSCQSARFITSSSLGPAAVMNTSENDSLVQETRRLPIRQCSVSRYHQEFHEVCKLGSGEFGDVFKCINRLDGCTYAIKRSKHAIAGSAMEISAWKEVCAHAVLVKHNHIVQYYSAWAEQDRMLIQNEYCNGGSLAEFLDSLKIGSIELSAAEAPGVTMMNENDLKTLLLHIAKGLSYMHSLHLAHLDIKPGNIFICRVPRRHHHLTTKSSTTGYCLPTIATGPSSAACSEGGSSVMLNEESGIESDDLYESEAESTTSSVASTSVFSELVTYKIGDLGHVTSTLHENPHVEEGDCRYLPNEILQENYSWLVKADIFALALTVFVAGSLEELPKNGDQWHWIRKGNLKDLPQCSDKFKKLLTQMIHEDPNQRPSASTLAHHPCICPDSTKTKAQLRRELNQEKFKNEILQRKVKRYEQHIHSREMDSPLGSGSILPPHRRLHPLDINPSSLSKSSAKLPRSFSSTALD